MPSPSAHDPLVLCRFRPATRALLDKERRVVIDAVDVVALCGAEVASFLAPCVVPLVPAWLGMVAGSAQRAVGSTLLFVAGFAAVFAALGTAAGAIGSSLDDVQDWLERVGGVLVVVFGLAL